MNQIPSNIQIIEMIIQCNNSRAEAAANLSLSSYYLHSRLKEMNVSPKDTAEMMIEKAKSTSNKSQLYLDFILAGQKT